MSFMFKDCSSLTSLDCSNWDTSNVTRMQEMFENCSSLKTLDLSNFDTSNLIEYSGATSIGSSGLMFIGVPLEYLILNSEEVKFVINPGPGSSFMFSYQYAYLNATCKILVPQNALETYKNSTYWSSRANYFEPIENYTIIRSNGQVIVTPK